MEKANELWLKNSGQHRTFSYGPAILGVEWFFLGMGGCACAKIPCAVSNAGGVSLSLSIAISESLAVEPRAKRKPSAQCPELMFRSAHQQLHLTSPGMGQPTYVIHFSCQRGLICLFNGQIFRQGVIFQGVIFRYFPGFRYFQGNISNHSYVTFVNWERHCCDPFSNQ